LEFLRGVTNGRGRKKPAGVTKGREPSYEVQTFR